MKHAELLLDQASLDRGEELIELFHDGNRVFNEQLRFEASLRENFDDVAANLANAALDKELDDAGYAALGRSIVEAARTQMSNDEDLENTLDLYDEAFGPVSEFLLTHKGKPVAAERLDAYSRPIRDLRPFREEYPSKIGGFLLPTMASYYEIHFSAHRWPRSWSGVIRTFDGARLKPVRLAIGE